MLDELPLEILVNLMKSMQKWYENILQSKRNASKYCVKYIQEKYECVLNLFPPTKFKIFQ